MYLNDRRVLVYVCVCAHLTLTKIFDWSKKKTKKSAEVIRSPSQIVSVRRTKWIWIKTKYCGLIEVSNTYGIFFDNNYLWHLTKKLFDFATNGEFVRNKVLQLSNSIQRKRSIFAEKSEKKKILGLSNQMICIWLPFACTKSNLWKWKRK